MPRGFSIEALVVSETVNYILCSHISRPLLREREFQSYRSQCMVEIDYAEIGPTDRCMGMSPAN